jgi:hypothetical protein
MPVISQIDSSLGVIFSEFQGVVTAEDILAQVERFNTDPAFQPSFNHLIDTRGTTRFDVSVADMRAVASHTTFNEKSRRAVVVDETEMYGAGRVYQILREEQGKPDQVRVFRDMEEARRWLGLD